MPHDRNGPKLVGDRTYFPEADQAAVEAAD